MSIRNSAKAVIIDGDMILLNKNQNTHGDLFYGLKNGMIYYDLPGGGQHKYEFLKSAVVRECLEETGYTVEVERLAAIYEEIAENETFREEFPEYAHKINFIFLCRLKNEPRKDITEADIDMTGSEWIKIENIDNIPIYPLTVKTNLKPILNSKTLLFLGSEIV